jgi:hypothetical protein
VALLKGEKMDESRKAECTRAAKWCEARTQELEEDWKRLSARQVGAYWQNSAYQQAKRTIMDKLRETEKDLAEKIRWIPPDPDVPVGQDPLRYRPPEQTDVIRNLEQENLEAWKDIVIDSLMHWKKKFTQAASGEKGKRD